MGATVPAWRAGIIVVLAALGAPGLSSAQVDVTGLWRGLVHEDLPQRADIREAGGLGAGDGAGGPLLGDYTGLPINDAARLKAESWDARIYASREHQTIVHPGAYWLLGGGGIRMWNVTDTATEQVVAIMIYRAGMPGSTTRTIWLDGRPHPPAYAAHTWQGFSTGRWEGNVLRIETTHLKRGWVRRNGVPASDAATLTEFLTVHGGYMTINRIVDDPTYLEEPLFHSVSWVRDPSLRIAAPPPSVIVEEVPGQSRAFVPHHLPGANQWLRELSDKYNLPFEATRGGKETQYPEYQGTLRRLMAVPSTR
jgi:hypothetical protein